MPKGESDGLKTACVAIGPASGPGVISSFGAAALTPPPTSPRKYQPLNSSSAADAGGRDGAGGKSAALAHPQEAAAIAAQARGPSLAMTTVPSVRRQATPPPETREKLSCPS